MPLAASRCGIEHRDLVIKLRKEVQEARQQIIQWNREGVKGGLQVAIYTQKIDTILRELFKVIYKWGHPTYSIVALGGYGRRELNLQSDIDLMILYQGERQEMEEQAFRGIQCLWDLGLHVGHSYRSVKEALSLGKEDVTIKTSFIDARIIGGSMNPFISFTKGLNERLIFPHLTTYLEDLYNWTQERHEKFGSSMYLLEPNVKESPGGLRDIHVILWIAKIVYGISAFGDFKRKGLLTPLEYETLENALDFIWRVRNDIHAVRNRKNDVLSLDIQPEVSHHMGYRDTKRLLGVEHFMKEYYGKVRDIRRVLRAFMLRTMEEMNMKQRGRLEEIKTIREVMEHPFSTPAHFLREVHRLQAEGIELEDIPRGFWVPPLHWREENFISPHVREIFKEILNAPRAYETLRFLHEIGFLERMFPQWERLTGLMQYDLYHRFTVDEHTLLAVHYLEALEGEEAEELAYLRKAYRELKGEVYILTLAILLHDIGKGKGGGHALRGARMANEILEQMGFPEELVDTVQFLVRHHTTMTQMALRRDTTDLRISVELAEICKTTKRLDMLYLITYADLRAVGPDVWTEWKGALILEVYLKARDLLEKGIWTLPPELDEISFNLIVGELHRYLNSESSLYEVRNYLMQFPERYIIHTPLKRMVEHFHLLKRARENGLAFSYIHNTDGGFTEVTMIKREHLGDLSKAVGILSSHRLNVISAWVFPRKDGFSLDIVQVSDPHFRPVTDGGLWRKIEEEMEEVFKDKIDLEELIRSRKGVYLSKREKVVRVKTKVALDNNISDKYSVIEIKAQDKLGLLYFITRSLSILGINIHMARITTEGNRAVDAFYVTKADGTKLTDREFISILKVLREAIEKEVLPIPVNL